MKKLIKRTDIVTFLDITPTNEQPTWAIVGDGMTTGAISYEAGTTSETYIINDSATTTVDNYNVSFEGEMKCIKGDEVFDYVDNLRITRATGDNAKSHVLNVYKYIVDEGGKYKSEMSDCSITLSSFGGDGGTTPTIAFSINMNGDPTLGLTNIDNGIPTFTPTI